MGETALRGLYHVLASSLLVIICFVKNDLPDRKNIWSSRCVRNGLIGGYAAGETPGVRSTAGDRQRV